MTSEKQEPHVFVSATIYAESGAMIEYSATFPGTELSSDQLQSILFGISGLQLNSPDDEREEIDTSRMFGGPQ